MWHCSPRLRGYRRTLEALRGRSCGKAAEPTSHTSCDAGAAADCFALDRKSCTKKGQRANPSRPICCGTRSHSPIRKRVMGVSVANVVARYKATPSCGLEDKGSMYHAGSSPEPPHGPWFARIRPQAEPNTRAAAGASIAAILQVTEGARRHTKRPRGPH